MSAEHNPALLLRGGTVIDGTGAPRFVADVRIEGERISAIGAQLPTQGAEVVDVAGKIVAPGFIDVHTHDDQIVLAAPQMLPKISQGRHHRRHRQLRHQPGVPLVLHDVPPPLNLLGGKDKYSIDDGRVYRSRGRQARPALTWPRWLGHSTLRVATMNDPSVSRDARRASANGRTAARRHGCRRYRPELRCSTRQVQPLASMNSLLAGIAGDAGGVYDAYPMSTKGADSLGMRLSLPDRRGNVPVVVSHHKCAGRITGAARCRRSRTRRRAQEQPIGSTCIRTSPARRCCAGKWSMASSTS
jgi:N-acyl-D-amino-acid deacylase